MIAFVGLSFSSQISMSITAPPGDSINNYEVAVSHVIGSVLISLRPLHKPILLPSNDAIKFQHGFFFLNYKINYSCL